MVRKTSVLSLLTLRTFDDSQWIREVGGGGFGSGFTGEVELGVIQRSSESQRGIYERYCQGE